MLSSTQAQVAVTVTGNTNTTPNLAASYTSLASALTGLNAVTAMSGPVTLTLAAGGSETAPVKGFVVGSSTLNPVLSATNTLTIVKAAGSPTVINAGVGTATPASASPDGMLYLNGADYVTIDGITFSDGNIASATVAMEFGIALFKRTAGDGCNNNTVQNCIFNMQRVNNSSGTAPMSDGSVAIIVVNSTASAATTALTPTNGGTLATNGTNSNNKIYSNQMNNGNSGIHLGGFAATSGVGPSPAPATFLGDINNDIGGTSSSTGNTILNFGGGATTSPSFGIRANNQWSVNIRYNTIDNNNGSGVNHATTLRGIYAQAGTSANATITNNNVTVRSGATTNALTAIDNAIGSTSASNAVDISNNTIRFSYTTATTGVFTAISNSASAASVTISSNNIQQLASTNYPSTGTVPVIVGGSPGGTLNITNNTISNFTMTGASGILRGVTSSTPTGLSTITGNTIENLSYNTSTSTGSITGIYNLASATLQNVNNNIIRNFSTPATGTLNGIQNNTTSGTFQCQNNQIYNFTTTAGGAGGFSANGITWSNASVTISGNIIYAINSTGSSGGTGGSINGIVVSGAATINGNAVYNLSSTSTNVTINGINVGASGTNNVTNNLIGDLRAPSSTGNISISGILVSSGTTNNIFHNTVNIASTTSSTTTFGTSAIYFSSSSPVNNLRNNIFVNTSTPGPTGGFSAAIRYVTAPTTTNFPATNNNNFYYAGTPAVNRVIYGESSGASAANGQQTIASYKTYISTTLPALGRESASVSEVPDWVSISGSNPVTDFLKYNTGTATQVEQGGAIGTGISTDFSGSNRCPATGCPGGASAPDMGAWELDGIAADLTGPVISYIALSNTLCTNGPTLTATITDASGVNVASGTAPRLYYRKSTDANTYSGNTSADDGWKFVESSSSSSPFSFTINAALLQAPVVSGDVIQYFVVAQDNASTSNVGANTATFAIAPTSVALTSASFPVSNTNSYSILTPLATSLTVGTAGDYPTLTGTGGLFSAINAAGLSGNTTVTILDASITETGTVALNQIAYGCSGPVTLTIKPQTASTLTGSVASGALIKLNGADYVIIDGSNSGGTDRSITIINTATTSPTAVWLASMGTGTGATNNTIKNCVITTSAATTSTAYGISISGATIGSAGGDNDNITIQNNLITSRNIGVHANGSSSTSTGGLDNLNISGNTFNSVSSSTLTTLIGIQLGNALGSSISQNNLSLVYAGAGQPVGISLETGVSGTLVTKNSITQVTTTSTGGYGGRGITVGTGSSNSNITISNNNISGVNGSNYSAFGNSSSMGIAIGIVGNSTSVTTVAGGVNLYHNSVNMYGSYNYSASCLTTALYVGSGASALDIRNNILVNSMNNTSSSGTASKNFAIYSAAANTAYSNINNNDYFVSGSQGALGFLASDQTTLSALTAGFGGNTSSISADPVFNSSSNLQPQPGSPVLGAGVAGTGVTVDYNGTTRNSPPTIGSYETGLDGIPPLISYMPLNNTLCTTGQTLTATINDVSGINTVSGTSPRLYYKKSTDANTFAGNTSADNGWKFVETTSSSSPFSFTINSALLQSPIASGDNIQYFVVAQDLAAIPNVNVNKATFTIAPASVALTASSFPASGTDSYTVIAPLPTSITVGAGGDYPTLTGAGGLFAAINAGGLSDNTTVTITSTSVTEAGTNALNQIAYGCSGPVSLTIKPQTASTLTGSVASGALIKLNGADNVIIDGSSSGGTDRSLTITNTATTSPTAIWIASAGVGAGSTNNTVKNCIINANAATSLTAYGISVSGATIGSAGADNDNITIRNNLITSTNVGVYANGSAAISSGGLDNLLVSENTFNSVSTTTLTTLIGIQSGNSLGSEISLNNLSLSYAAAGTPVGISLETGVSGALVTRNNITQITTTNTGGYGGRGITVGTGSTNSNITVSNNNISGVNGSNYSTFGSSSAIGIAIGVLGNSSTLTTVTGGINLYHNTVNMYGSYSYTTACITAALYVGSGASTLDIRNNIFVNSMNNTSGSGTGSRSYALYCTASNTVFTNINYNDYYSGGTQGTLCFLSSNRNSMTALRTATGQDVNSFSSSPSFVSNTDLHLNPTGNDCMDKRGVPIASVTTDFDGTSRDTLRPDIGMDEFTSSTDFNIQIVEYSELSDNDGKVCSGASATLVASNGTAYLWSTGSFFSTTTVSPVNTATYTVTITLNGCSVTSSYTVFTTPLSVVTTAFTETSGVNNNDGIICAGNSATISVNGSYNNYYWSNGSTSSSITESPGNTSTYTVTIIDANSCISSTTATITVRALPISGIVTSEISGNTHDDGIICLGASVTIGASGGDNYIWNTGDSTSSFAVSPGTATTYSVTVTDANICSTNTSATVTVNQPPSPSVSFSDTSGNSDNDGVICVGENVTLAVLESGSYLWESSDTLQSITITPSSSGTYSVTFTDNNGCSAATSATVTVNTLPSPPIVYGEISGNSHNDGVICLGDAVALSVSGMVSQEWSNSQTTSSISVSPSSTTTYTVSVTDSNGCQGTSTTTVNVNSLPTASVTVSESSGITNNDGIICIGSSVALTGGGGESYVWNTNASTASITVSPSSGTSYTVTVKDQNHCFSSTSSAITVNSLPTPSISVTDNSGSLNDGIILIGASATLTASGGTSYLWNTGAAAAALVVTPDSTTTYSVVVTNDNGCTATSSATITVVLEQLPIISVSETSGNNNNDGKICTGASITLSATNGESFVWSTGSSTSATTVTPTTTTTYTVTATDSFGLTSTASATVTVYALPTPSVTAAETSGNTHDDGIICVGASVSLTATGGIGYLWDTGGNAASVTVSPSVTTTYTVTVTNENGCTATSTRTITVNSLPTPSVSVAETSGTTNNDAIICTGASVSLSASGGTSYLWANGATTTSITVSPSVTTTYTVTATNVNGCSATSTRTITVNDLPTPSVSVSDNSGSQPNDGIICIGASTTLTAAGGTSYVWNTSATTVSITVSPTTTTTYSVTVTNANLCSSATTRTVTVNALPTPSVSVSETSGLANNDGTVCAGASATLTASGGTSYLWSNGGTAASITVSPSATTTYTVTATNSNGCTATSTRSVTVTPLPTPAITVVESSGSNNNDGSICIGAGASLTASGGTSYSWSNGSASASITVSPTATTTYTVTVTNANGCTTATSTSITVNPLPVPGITVAETSGLQNNDAVICSGSPAVLTASGGSAYLWSNGGTSAAITVTPAATAAYSVTVTSAAGCSAVTSVTITVNPLPVPVLLTSDMSGLLNDDGIICSDATATISASGGSSYLWSNGASSSSVSVSPQATTTYTVTVTSSDACVSTATRTVTVNALPVPSFSYSETSGLTNNDGVICAGSSVMITASGGTSYAWNTGGATSTITVSPSATTTYTVTVTNANGCPAVANSAVTVNTVPVASIAVTEMSGAADNDGIILIGDSATLAASGGTSYNWNTGASTSVITVTPAVTTTYTVTVTNSNGCTSTANTTITASLQQMPVITVTETSGVDNNDGIICTGASATLSVAGGTSYLWNNGSTSNVLVVSPSVTTTYTVTDTDTRGNTTSTSVTIVVNSLPTPSVATAETSGVASNDGIICIGASVTLSASGGTSYSWSNGGIVSSFTVSPSSTTTFTVTVTNANGCTASTSVTISVNPLPTPSVAVAETSGVGNNDGITCSGANAILTASGGTSYSWNTGGTTAAITVAPTTTTTYTVTVTNANGCSATATRTISVTPLPTPLVSASETSGIANNDGIVCIGASATLTATGGATYIWNDGSTTASVVVTPTSTTTYTVTVTNANNCSATTTSVVTVNPLPSPVISVAETSGLANNDGIICVGASTTLTASGGTAYSWSNGSATDAITVSPSVTTSYTVTVTNANGCSATRAITITVNPIPVASLSVSETSGAVNNDGNICLGSSAYLIATGGTSYAWSNGSTAGIITVFPPVTTTYTVTVSNANGCTTTATTTVTVFFPPSVTAVSTVCAPTASVITLTGDFFTGTSQVSMNGTNCPSFTVISATQINVSKPISGPIQSVSVTNTCGTTTYQANVSVTSFSPSAGQPGTIVDITGVNMACLQSVTIGGVPQIILANNDNSARVFIMPGSTTGPITVTSTNNSTAASAATYTVSATPNPYVQQGNKQVGGSAIGNAQQGTSVAVSSDGNTAVIGGSFDDTNKGAAWIYVRNGTAWSQQGGKLIGTGAVGTAKQGTAVAISAEGNTVAVGGPLDNTSAGAVWIFTRSSGVWSQQGNKLTGTGAAGNAQQGSALSLSASGDILAVGGPADNMFGGATWIFTRSAGTWTQEGSKLAGSGMVGQARQGGSVAISSDGTTLIVGGNNDMNRRGAAWIFTRDSGGTWSQQGAKLVGTGGSSDAWQGISVAISANGNTALVGGSNDNSLKGAAWVFTRSSGVWSQQGAKLSGTGAVGSARQGTSLGLSADGNTAVIGGAGDDSSKGTMWVFKRSGSTWTQQGSKVNGGGATGSAKQGTSISVSSNGTTAVLGGPADNTNKGAFWFFVPNTSLADTKTDVRVPDVPVTETAGFTLQQNIPNPLTDRTTVGFDLPEACTAEWQITDMSGRVVLSLKREYPAGNNIEIFDLNAYQGVYYYTLKTPSGSKTRKMVVVR